MSHDKVTIDPEFRPSEPGRDGDSGGRRGWVALAAIVAVLLAVGWLVRGVEDPAPEPNDDSATCGTTIPRRGTTPAPNTGSSSPIVIPVGVSRTVWDAGLGAALPGFADTVTAVIWGNRGIDIMSWPPSQAGPETVVSLAHADGGRNQVVDAGGAWWSEIRGDSTLIAHPVRSEAVGPQRKRLLGPEDEVRVWSAVWHDTRPARLAWLACANDPPGSAPALSTIDLNDPAARSEELPLPDLRCERPNAWLARWGDWGILLHTTESPGADQLLMDHDGEEVAAGRLAPDGEWFVGDGPDGTTVWTEGPQRPGASSFLLSPDGRDRSAVPGIGPEERLEISVGSPDGAYLALVPDLEAGHGSAVRIVDSDTGATVVEISEPSRWVTRLAWSSAGRFLLYQRWPDVASNWAGVPEDVELVVYDIERGAGVAVPLPGHAAALRSGAG